MMRTREQVAGTLYVVGTPIGNLHDLSPRARDVLGDVHVIAAEDTRRTRGLLSSIGLQTPIIAYHEHNERERAPQIVATLLDGQSVALVSDAGMPLISDPGWRLVREARSGGIDVLSVPGPSAVCAALSVAGLATDRYAFEGFLPRRAGARDERLRQLAAEPRTLVFFESVHRLPDSLAAMAQRFGTARPAALARELTKVHESTYTGTLAELATRLGEDIPLRGEFVVLVAGHEASADVDEAELQRVYAIVSEELPPDRALALSARLAGVKRNVAYRLIRVRE